MTIQVGNSYRFESKSPISGLMNGQVATVLKPLPVERGRASYLVRFESGREEVAFEDELLSLVDEP